MVFDNPFAEGKAEAGTVGFAMRDERLEKPVGDFGSNTGAGVFHFRSDFVFTRLNAQPEVSAARHHIRSMVQLIEEHPGQASGIKRTG